VVLSSKKELLKIEELKELKKLINKARNYEIKKCDLVNNIFGILDELNIDLEAKTNAENADNLSNAITCHIDYGEYSIESIIKEIKSQINK